MAHQLEGFGAGALALPFMASAIVGVATSIMSGLAATSLFCGIFIPMALDAGFNPASMAMLIPNNGLGIMFPWAGAAAGTAFATGYLNLKEMIKVGAVVTGFLALVTASVHLLFSGWL